MLSYMVHVYGINYSATKMWFRVMEHVTIRSDIDHRASIYGSCYRP